MSFNPWDGAVGASDIMGSTKSHRFDQWGPVKFFKNEGNLSMSKQVKVQVAVEAPAAVVAEKSLFVSVITHDTKGEVIGERIVDMYHFGTRNWLHNHAWWAMHNGHVLTTVVAGPKDVDAYLAAGKAALAEKFNHTKAA